jgi:hypothetical protein
MTAIIEMRTYKTRPGKRGELLELFNARSLPAHLIDKWDVVLVEDTHGLMGEWPR